MALKDKFFNISEAASYLDVTRQTVARWISEGRLVGEKVGGIVLIDRDDVYKYDNDRALADISQSVIRLIINRLRDELKLSKEDLIVWTKSIEDGVFTFSLHKANGSHQMVHIDIGTLIEISVRKNTWHLALPTLNTRNISVEDEEVDIEDIKEVLVSLDIV